MATSAATAHPNARSIRVVHTYSYLPGSWVVLWGERQPHTSKYHSTRDRVSDADNIGEWFFGGDHPNITMKQVAH